ncbi:MAG: type IX secretion system membrane protein PorP/SprF [Saprospiraceae bacterium]|nr:type IX secretion system membrane protein PorP/SprF [Saprospiraceae bacterium]
MKRWLTWIVSLLLLMPAMHLAGQQQGLYTMFMFNKLGLNPGYAGYHDHACVSAIYRSQWLGFEGAPESQMVSIQGPVNQQRIGLGLNLHRMSLGISSQVTLDGIYAYRIPMGSGTLSLGAQASVRQMRVDYSDPALRAVQDLSFDPGVDIGTESKTVANFGAGLYFNTDRFYVGFSVPRLMNADIDFEENNLFVSREEQHFYLMTGYVLKLDYTLDLVPQVLVKYVNGAPVNVDINASIVWKRDYTFGLTARTGGADGDTFDSLDALVAARVARGLTLGVAYDLTLSELSKHANGSLELVLRYCFNEDARQIKFENPRYF